MKHLAWLLILGGTAFATTITTHEGNTLIRPFGYIAPRPPATARTVDLEFDVFDFTAQQVCGYTDWSSAVIKLPKQLLSTEYWRRIGNNLRQQALNSVLAISGALPSMLACNASPTFCAILNKAEMLAQANLRFTFDSCQMLEELNDATKSQFQSLRGCVKSKVDGGDDSSVALDKCTLGDGDPSSKDKINNAIKFVTDNYRSELLDKKLCRDVDHKGYSSSDRVYTVAETACHWSKSLGGISLSAGTKFRQGGTFAQSPGEKLYEERIKKTSLFIIELLDLMHDIRFGKGQYSSEGPSPRQKVVLHSDVLRKIKMRPNGEIIGVCYNNDQNCKPNVKDLPPIYRLSTTGSPPALMIAPATLYELVDLIPAGTSPGREYKMSSMSQIAFAIEPLIQSTSYAHVQEVNQEAISRLIEACGEAKMQSQAAQEDCHFRLSRLNQSMKNLEKRYDSDRKHMAAQALYYAELEKIKHSRITIQNDSITSSKDPTQPPHTLR
ncbi:MAG: hypothetical protein H6618_08855 [Deltaproteobacteria bacterium]|nr:hypothetical protein [Deltaproteobacteria bacterium]